MLPEQRKKKAYQLLLQHIVLGCVFACVLDGSLGTLCDFQLCCLGVKMCPCGREHFICVLVRLAGWQSFRRKTMVLGLPGESGKSLVLQEGSHSDVYNLKKYEALQWF